MFTEITMLDYARPLRQRLESRKYCGPYRWTPTQAPSSGRGFYQATRALEMDCSGSTLNLRLVEVPPTHRGITGYYADEFGNQIITPIVARLPHGRGFLAGWTMGRGMCASLETTIWADFDEACRAAHDEAEHAAERCREDEARWQEEQECFEETDEDC